MGHASTPPPRWTQAHSLQMQPVGPGKPGGIGGRLAGGATSPWCWGLSYAATEAEAAALPSRAVQASLRPTAFSPAPARPSQRDPRHRCHRLSLAPRRLFPSIQPVSGQRAEQRTGETEPAASFTTHFKKLCGFSAECFEWRRSNPCTLKLPVHPRPAASGPPLHPKHPSVPHPSVTPLQDKGFLLDPAWVRLPRAVFDEPSTSGPAFSLPRPVVTRISPSQRGQDPHHV